MGKQITFPRLTRRQCERLLDVHQQLNRVKEACEHASWAGGRMAGAGIMSALVLVAELYNGAERAFLSSPGQGKRPSPENGEVEATAAPAEADRRLELVVDKPEV